MRVATTGAAASGPYQGVNPSWIYVRRWFVVRPTTDGPEPALARLVKSKGLQLRLLLIFDAQCRYGPGDTVRNVRDVRDMRWRHANQEHAPWRQLVLETQPHAGTDQRPHDLRARQITEAMRALDEQHLLWLPRYSGGKRR